MTLLSDIYDVTLKRGNRGAAKNGWVRATVGETYVTHKDFKYVLGVPSYKMGDSGKGLTNKPFSKAIKMDETHFMVVRQSYEDYSDYHTRAVVYEYKNNTLTEIDSYVIYDVVADSVRGNNYISDMDKIDDSHYTIVIYKYLFHIYLNEDLTFNKSIKLSVNTGSTTTQNAVKVGNYICTTTKASSGASAYTTSRSYSENGSEEEDYYDFNPSTSTYVNTMDLARLDDTHVLGAFQYSNRGSGHLKILNVNDSNGVLTAVGGTSFAFETSDQYEDMKVLVLDPTHFMIYYLSPNNKRYFNLSVYEIEKQIDDTYTTTLKSTDTISTSEYNPSVFGLIKIADNKIMLGVYEDTINYIKILSYDENYVFTNTDTYSINGNTYNKSLCLINDREVLICNDDALEILSLNA